MLITRSFIKDCSVILGRFDDVRVEKLVTLYQHQSSGSQLNLLSSEIREKFENLLTVKSTDQMNYDTPLTRIELAVLNDFKQKYLAEPVQNPEKQRTRTNTHLCINDELTSAYCYLFAQVDDRINYSNLKGLHFVLKLDAGVPSENLFDIYQASNNEIANFLNRIYTCGYFRERNVIIMNLIVSFQSFIVRYKEFLILFQKYYQSSPENGARYTQIDAIINHENNTQQQTSLFASQIKADNRVTIEKPSQIVTPMSTLPSNVQSVSNLSIRKRKGLCVIINIMEFSVNGSVQKDKRAGSEKDVDLIRSTFCELNFTVLECKFNFQEAHIRQALQEVDDPKNYGDYECLVMFIMSHGYLHSFFTADQRAIVIRDIVKRYSDSSSTTIWKGKARMFFIQACRSPWPTRQQPRDLKGVKQNDLSPKMLVAFSCSEEEASKRCTKSGSIFIQMLCMMIIRYGHCYKLQNILGLTRQFVSSFDDLSAEVTQQEISPQRPEFIEHKFDENFRFASKCVYDDYEKWAKETQNSICISDRIWKELYSRIFENKLSIRN